MLILAVHTGGHDATAVLAQDYDILAAVQLERLTRIKGDGNRFPDEAVDEVAASVLLGSGARYDWVIGAPPERVASEEPAPGWVAESPSMQSVYERVAQVAALP